MSRTNKNIQIITPQNFFEILHEKHLLLDASVFIDTLNHPKEFLEFFKSCRENHTILTTVLPVRIEFLKGLQDDTVMNDRLKYLTQIIGDEDNPHKEYILPFDKNIFEKFELLLRKYKLDGSKISLADLTLGASLMHFGPRVLLLTKNITEFPTTIFSRKTYLILEMRKALQIYGVYTYDKE